MIFITDFSFAVPTLILPTKVSVPTPLHSTVCPSEVRAVVGSANVTVNASPSASLTIEPVIDLTFVVSSPLFSPVVSAIPPSRPSSDTLAVTFIAIG